MPYSPGVQDISGQLIAQGMNRGQDAYYSNLNNNINQFFKTREEDSAFQAKNKAMQAMITANKEEFGLNDETLKPFLKGSTFESPRDAYARMGTFVETNVLMANQKRAAANAKSEIDQRAAQTRLLEVNAAAHQQDMAAKEKAALDVQAQKDFLGNLNQFSQPSTPIIDRNKIVSNPSLVNYGNANITAPGTGVLSKEILSQFQVPKYTGAETPTYAGSSPNTAVPTRGGGVLSTGTQEDFKALQKQPYVQEQLRILEATGQLGSPANIEANLTRRAIAEQAAQSRSIKDPADYKEADPVTGTIYDVTSRGGVVRKTINPDYVKSVAAENKVAAVAKQKADVEMAQSNIFADKARVGLGAIDTAKELINKSHFGNFLLNKTDINAALSTIKSSVALTELRRLKESGVSLGQIAKFEIEMLEASQGNLEWSGLRDSKQLLEVLSRIERNFGNVVKANSMKLEGKTDQEIGKYLLNQRSDEDVVATYKRDNPKTIKNDEQIVTEHQIKLARANNPNGKIIDLGVFDPNSRTLVPTIEIPGKIDGLTTPANSLSPSAQRYYNSARKT